MTLALAGLIVANPPSIVTRGPGVADARMNAIWTLVSDEPPADPAEGEDAPPPAANSPPPTPAELEEAGRRTLAVLRREPLNSLAVSLIANVRLLQGREAEGEALMVAAERINHRENIADLWLFDRRLAQKNYAEAFRVADALLRREREFTERLFPKLVGSLSDPNAVEALAKRLALDPGWRPGFTFALTQAANEPQDVFTLLAAMKRAGGQITHQEMSDVVSRLIGQRRFEEAYLDWLILMPDAATAKLAYVYDGEFEGLPDARPFGWSLDNGAGYIETAPGRSDDALHAVYSGPEPRDFGAQLIVLPPGRYEFTGEVMAANPSAVGQVSWRILCMQQPSGALLTAPAPNAVNQWRSFAIPFTVPPDCPAQTLLLTRTATDRAPEIDVWYDKLGVRPAGGAQ